MKEIKVLIGDAEFRIRLSHDELKISNEWKDTSHFHVYNEIHCIQSGSAFIEIDGNDVELSACDICFLKPKICHYPKGFDNNLARLSFSFEIFNNRKEKRDSKFSEFSYYSNIFDSVEKYTIVNDNCLIETIKKIIETKYSEENEHEIQCLYAMFFIEFAKKIKRIDFNNEKRIIDSYGNDERSRQKKIIEEFIQNRFGEDVAINDLASELCVSASQTYRIVKGVFNEGFKQIMVRQRIEHACMLIKQGGKSLDDVAYLCGYNSYNGFFFAFKKVVGMSPEEYKNSLKIDK